MAGTFFDFDSTLPPDDPGQGLEEEEEQHYDALNDETFGTAIEDDWEQDHEQLSKLTETSRGWNNDFDDCNHNDHDDLRNGQDHLEASLSQLVLEDNDDISVNRKSSSHIPHSNLVPYPESPNALRNSVWAVGKHDGPLSSSSPLRPRVALPQGVKNVCTVEELERNLLQMRSGGVSGSSLPPPPGLGSPSPGGALRLEDLERKITQAAPQPRMNMISDMPTRFPPGLGRGNNLLNSLQNQRLIGPQGHIEAPKVPLQQLPLGFGNSNIPPYFAMRQQHSFQPIHPGPGMMPLGPHQQQQQHLPFNMNGPRIPPPHMNNHLAHHMHQQHPQHPQHPQHQQHPQHPQHPQHHQHMAHQQHRNSHLLPHHHHQPHHPHHHLQQQHHHHQQQQQQQHHQQHRMNGAGDYDEYAGLMTPWQKQWLLNIQTLQLNVGVPYVVDYYYTVYKNRKERRNSDNSKSDSFFGRPESVRSGRDRSESTKPGRERPPSVMARAYTPLQFENSLGKLQCVSVTAPRKLIDMEIMASEGSDGQSTQKDLKKTKQLLLEIERLYVLLLDLEDAFDPQAIEAAAEAAVARAMRDPPDNEPEPEKPPPEELITRMTSVLLQGDKIFGFMGIRKGKTFLLRLLPHLPAGAGVHFAFWGQVLYGLSALVRRDQADGLLPRFLPELKRWLGVSDLPQILKLTTSLVAEATMKSKSSRSALSAAVNSKFGVLALGAILTATEKHLSEMDEEQKTEWGGFISSVATVAETARVADDSSVQRASPIAPETLQRHIDVCDAAVASKYGAFLKRLFLSDTLKTDTVQAPEKIIRRANDSTLNSPN